jgi:hypothetical protein
LFRFEKARKAKQLEFARKRVKGMSLVEIVEEYGDPALTARPAIPYDEKVAEDMKGFIDEQMRKGTLEVAGGADANEYLWHYCDELGLERDYCEMYDCLAASHNLWICVGTELMTEFFVKEEGYVEDYFWNGFLHQYIPEFYLVPILFPAKKDERTATFGMSDSQRNKLIDGVFSRLSDLDHFRSIVNDFAVNHIYFRDYPLFGTSDLSHGIVAK